MARLLRFAVWCFLLILISTVSVIAQTNYATLRGIVFDPQHRPVSGSRVTLTSGSTGVERSLIANAEGGYEAAGLLPGSWSIRATASGFAISTQTLSLEVGQQMELDIALSLAQD